QEQGRRNPRRRMRALVDDEVERHVRRGRPREGYEASRRQPANHRSGSGSSVHETLSFKRPDGNSARAAGCGPEYSSRSSAKRSHGPSSVTPADQAPAAGGGGFSLNDPRESRRQFHAANVRSRSIPTPNCKSKWTNA